MQRDARVTGSWPIQLEKKRFAVGIVGETVGRCCGEQGNRVGYACHRLLLQISPRRLAKTALFIFIALGLLVPSILLAQIVPTATLTGLVTDPAGAVVSSATVQIVNTETQVTKETTADAQGRFLFSFLQPGSYQLNVSASGFNAYHQTGITLNVNAPATVNVSLAVHSASAEVTVRSNAEMIDTQSSTLHQIVGQQYLQNLPLNGRNAATLVTLAPGVVTSPGEYNDSYANSGNEVAYSVNGTYGDQVSYNLDGAPHEDLISNLNATFPNPDALAEFSVQTNNFDARFGGVGGAVVNIVTKSGTNQIHGALFEYVRNGDLNAINYFASKQDLLKRNQFGGVIGGPILKNKLFYFASFQGTTINNVTEASVAFVPTTAERQGIFPTTVKNPVTGLPFPGNTIPTALFNPLSTNMLPHIPTTTDPAGKLLYSRPSETRNYEGLGKVDYTFRTSSTDGERLFRELHITWVGWRRYATQLRPQPDSDYQRGKIQRYFRDQLEYGELVRSGYASSKFQSDHCGSVFHLRFRNDKRRGTCREISRNRNQRNRIYRLGNRYVITARQMVSGGD